MTDTTDNHEPTRRDFIHIAAGSFAGVGAALAIWPFVDQMNPSADVLALASLEVDISSLAEGQEITVSWRGKPVFIRYRTADDIAAAQDVDVATLPDPQADSDRVKADRPEILVMVGVCTHLGCVPIGAGGNQGDYGGWYCPCHGSHYDKSGRIRKGPAPLNLEVPKWQFVADNKILIG